MNTLASGRARHYGRRNVNDRIRFENSLESQRISNEGSDQDLDIAREASRSLFSFRIKLLLTANFNQMPRALYFFLLLRRSPEYCRLCSLFGCVRQDE
jgi:hypothetical protein